MNILLIVASGKSSRFGGFPKAFCKIGDKTNADNTIEKAKKLYDKVYIGVNRNTFVEYSEKITGCEMFSIITGQGDAHSILKCLTYVRERESDLKRITVCWGDAVFVDELPFKQLIEGAGGSKVAVACAMDEHPYAWFETNENDEILRSHFAKDEGFIDEGLHDQSLFLFDVDFALKYLNEYRESLGIPYDNDESKADKNEMKLLYSFEYLYKVGYDHAKCIEITGGKILSFNTQDELEAIKAKILK